MSDVKRVAALVYWIERDGDKETLVPIATATIVEREKAFVIDFYDMVTIEPGRTMVVKMI